MTWSSSAVESVATELHCTQLRACVPSSALPAKPPVSRLLRHESFLGHPPDVPFMTGSLVKVASVSRDAGMVARKTLLSPVACVTGAEDSSDRGP